MNLTKNAILQTLIALAIYTNVGTVSAQTYVEDSAKSRRAFCEWSFKGKSGSEACPLLALGVMRAGGDANIIMFKLDGMTISMIEERGRRRVEIGDGDYDNFKPKWKGTYSDKRLGSSKNLFRFSNGYQVIMTIF